MRRSCSPQIGPTPLSAEPACSPQLMLKMLRTDCTERLPSSTCRLVKKSSRVGGLRCSLATCQSASSTGHCQAPQPAKGTFRPANLFYSCLQPPAWITFPPLCQDLVSTLPPCTRAGLCSHNGCQDTSPDTQDSWARSLTASLAMPACVRWTANHCGKDELSPQHPSCLPQGSCSHDAVT